jgi:DNA polymerase-3 subunit delta'
MGIAFQDLEGCDTVTTFFQRVLSQGRLAHAYLFYGPLEAPKKEFALELVKALNCEQGPLNACDQCRFCRQIMHGNHLDVITIQPDGGLIKIDQLRSLQRRFRMKAAKHSYRAVIIEQAEKMRAEAANSLLKFLEEPPSPMVVILLTEQLSAVLPTIRSRCQPIRFAAQPPAVKAKQWQKKGFSPELATLLAHLTLRPQEADIGEENKWREEIDHLITWNQKILKGSTAALLTVEEDWFRNWLAEQKIPLLLEYLMLWYRELLLYSAEGRTHLFPSWVEACQQQIRMWSTDQLHTGFSEIAAAATKLETTFLQPKSIVEQMVLQMQANAVAL